MHLTGGPCWTAEYLWELPAASHLSSSLSSTSSTLSVRWASTVSAFLSMCSSASDRGAGGHACPLPGGESGRLQRWLKMQGAGQGHSLPLGLGQPRVHWRSLRPPGSIHFICSPPCSVAALWGALRARQGHKWGCRQSCVAMQLGGIIIRLSLASDIAPSALPAQQPGRLVGHIMCRPHDASAKLPLAFNCSSYVCYAGFSHGF